MRDARLAVGLTVGLRLGLCLCLGLWAAVAGALAVSGRVDMGILESLADKKTGAASLRTPPQRASKSFEAVKVGLRKTPSFLLELDGAAGHLAHERRVLVHALHKELVDSDLNLPHGGDGQHGGGAVSGAQVASVGRQSLGLSGRCAANGSTTRTRAC